MFPHSFTLELSALTDGKYRLTARPAFSNEIQVVLNSPFRSQEIDDCFAILSPRKHNITLLEQAKAMRQFGQKLFNFVIGDHSAIHNAYVANLFNVGQEGTRLILAVDKAGPLSRLLWELIRDPRRDFLALSGSISVARTTSQMDKRAPVPLLRPLRVLVITATRDAEQEWQLLEQATEASRRSGQLCLDRLHHASLSALRLRLLAEDYPVIHYIGRAHMHNQPFLIMGDEENDLLSPNDLSRELYPESAVRLLMLTPCQSSYQAMTVVAGRVCVPAALTLQFPVSRRASVLFLREFYSALLQGMPIDAALCQARRTLANRLQNGAWAAPVLFVHPDTLRLFQPISGHPPALQPAR